MTVPIRNTLSTASSSGFQPTPSSRIGVICASQRLVPVWCVDARQDSSSVLFPEPFRPMMPEGFALMDIEADVVEHLTMRSTDVDEETRTHVLERCRAARWEC